MADLNRVRVWANALIALHLNPQEWTFGFDNAKTRAGLCNFTAKRITVSRYLAARYEDDEVHQILLHEVAHALAGARAGHGPRWRAQARELGYDGSRLHYGAVADELAPWVGMCPGGHVHYRYRKPTRVVSCGKCSRAFSRADLIDWRRREISAATRRQAASFVPAAPDTSEPSVSAEPSVAPQLSTAAKPSAAPQPPAAARPSRAAEPLLEPQLSAEQADTLF